jgi:glycosyltransferase involved in cell wall biosynthesis
MTSSPARATVLHIITRLDLGGSAENTLLTALGIIARGYRTTIICGYSDNPPSVNEQKAAAAGVGILRIRHLVRNISPWHDLCAILWLVVYLKRNRCDLVHTHTSKAGVVGRVAACIAGVGPVVHTPHGHIFYGYFSRMITGVFVYVERVLMRFTDIQITLTQKEKNDYLQKGIGPAHRHVPVYSGIELGPFLSRTPDCVAARAGLGLDIAHVVAGTVARLVPVKNHSYIVEAAALCKDRTPGLRFVFVGDGELREDLQGRIDGHGMTGRFVLTGWRNDIAGLMDAFDVFVMCSKNEGMGRAFVEAQASGVPVVGTRVGGIAEVLDEGRTGFLVGLGDPEELAGIFVRLYEDKNLRDELARNCRPWVVPRFSAEAMVDKIEDIYAGLLRPRARGPHTDRGAVP